MDPMLAVGLAIGLLFVLLLARIPVAWSLLVAGAVGVLLVQGERGASGLLARAPFETPGNYVLIIIPMFIAMGIFAKHGTVAEDGFAVAARLLRRMPGGLALATVLGCAGFAAVSGSSVATVATLGPLATREMEAHGYDRTVAVGVVGASGTLGVLIPPSIVLVLYGILTGESIGRLLVAGVIPGVLSAIIYGLALFLRARRHPELMGGSAGDGGTDARVVAREAAADSGAPVPARGAVTSAPGRPAVRVPNTDVSVAGTSPSGQIPLASIAKVMVLFVVVVGGIYAGLVSATEAAALGAAVALVFYLADLRREPRGTRMRSLGRAFAEATHLTSMAMALLIGGAVFTYLLVVARVPSTFASWVVGLEVPGMVIVALLLLAFVPLGMFLDPLSTMLVAVPLAYPTVVALGFDGIWFGILVVKMIEIGLITPPFGMNAFVVAGAVPDTTVPQAFRGILWFLPLDVATVALLFAVPALVTWLPSITNPL